MTATQISTVHAGTVEEDARRVLSGNLCGKCQNHTALEHNPWWEIDLESICLVHEMRLFNRLDGVPERVANFVLQGSLDNQEWFVMTRKMTASFMVELTAILTSGLTSLAFRPAFSG